MRRISHCQVPLWAAVLLLGCATVPKPQELVAYEAQRAGEPAKIAEEEQSALVAESDRAHERSLEAWEDEELELAKHFATLATIKLRTALTLIAQQQTQKRMAEVKKQLAQVRARQAKLDQQRAEVEEKTRLYEQLAMARSATKERELQLSEAQKKAEAQKKVGKAQLALKLAETVDAAKHAKTSFQLAQTMVNQALEALKNGDSANAAATAEMAKAKADAAYEAARPIYQKEQQTASRQARNQALQRDAAAISGVTVKLKAVGQTQQLVLPVLNLFKPRSTTPKPEMSGTITAVGQLLKKYPDYPVLIEGHTSYRVRRNQRYAVSQARAQAVANQFVAMGLPLKRFAVSGRGAEKLVGRRWSTENDRVEITLLFQ
jgi:outer membrane protein OmpA-like peptidoglycan-associated protein